MNNKSKTIFALMAFSALALSVPVITGTNTKAVAQGNDTISQSGIAKEDLESFIYDYLMENPGVIIEAVEKLRQNQEVEEAKMVEQKLEQHQNFCIPMMAPHHLSATPMPISLSSNFSIIIAAIANRLSRMSRP